MSDLVVVVVVILTADVIVIRDAYRLERVQKVFLVSWAASLNNNHKESKLIYFTVCHSYNYMQLTICGYKLLLVCFFRFFVFRRCRCSHRYSGCIFMSLWYYDCSEFSHKCNKNSFVGMLCVSHNFLLLLFLLFHFYFSRVICQERVVFVVKAHSHQQCIQCVSLSVELKHLSVSFIIIDSYFVCAHSQMVITFQQSHVCSLSHSRNYKQKKEQ